jgi:hypothetical protein
VGIGISTAPLAKLHLEGTGDMIRVVKNVDSYGPQLDLILNQTSPSNGDTAAYINMGAKDNSGTPKYWGSIRAVVDNIFTELGGFEFYTRAATDFNKRLKISAQGKVIVYQKDNVSGFYLDGANTRLYANGGGGTDYRGIECNSSGMWSWGETGLSNFFAKKVGIGISSPKAELDVDGDVNTTGYLANTLEFSTYFGSGTTVIATLNGSFESGTTAVASIEYVGLYAYAGTSNTLGIIMASTRRSNGNTAWSNVNDETVHVAGAASQEPTLYWDNGLLKITVGSSVQISCRIRITYHGNSTGLTRNHSA